MRSDLTWESGHSSCLLFLLLIHSLTLWHLSSFCYMLAPWKLVVLNFSLHQYYLESLLERRSLGSTPSTSESVGLERGLNICISTSSQVLLTLPLPPLLLLLWDPHFENLRSMETAVWPWERLFSESKKTYPLPTSENYWKDLKLVNETKHCESIF